MSRLNGFNRIAPWYDTVKRFVFGSSILSGQTRFLSALPLAGDFLVLGGGSGEILKPFLHDRPTARVWYIEASSRMITLAKKNLPSEREGCVLFIHGTEDAIPVDQRFDGVMTHFFLDLFRDADLVPMCHRITRQLKADGMWLVSDFVDGGKRWHRLMLWFMYRFFLLTAGIRATRLPNWDGALCSCGLRPVLTARLYGNFIASRVYSKANAAVIPGRLVLSRQQTILHI